MAESMLCSLKVLTSEVDLFTKFKLHMEKVIDVGMCGEIVLAKSQGKACANIVVKKFNRLDKDKKSINQKAFYTEVKLMKSFKHPSLIKCLLSGECPEYQAFCMQYYQRGTLDLYIENPDFEITERCITQVGCALRYMHNRNVVHMDVKLDNIFMDNNFNAVLGDFGLSQVLLPNQKTVCNVSSGGTLCYFAPERNEKPIKKAIDPYKIDSYCLGVVLWALVMKRHPDNGINYELEARKKTDLSKNIRNMLIQLLEKNPTRRPTIADVLIQVQSWSSYKNIFDTL